ncbi:TPA: hypothetical protein MCG79_005294 [Klebsiella pneumoniae]|nr:hypothetical protein [Klebsiella pneumoniae]WFL88720.1 hypothetical protein P8T37_05615 [Klebsiella pneumoniae]WFL93742.1 hypothetical protein P8T35_04950 [Klebsiella pneumoniae]WFL95655.1 hypothetical protein P8T49_13425 [Klebsiella pneumoniae]WFM05360.1 hypothetical protein P8T41_12375 [Klebsiella pneumoniae]WFM10164.1 hypothetical protein P8T45_10825 [Klebsiella pneumoniae]
MTDKIRQLRRRCPCQRPGDITARQSLQRCRGCLDTPLDIAARAVFRLLIFVRLRLFQLLR